ncbi:hypothetical protein CEUSTIGMA_g6582.t1 [Chlamydomonas eustigma]|uniref:Uncharacterized protein n=1 Tax=Chlamydomonas eustigma TaxID=1157962 RepID=A0A250X8C5_9CHLO|nr:hypothetical protein CEUSTIGMA_g6582.t1 [Chlamydomonas eustigma]|eukprot:GAX79142.1 hypothetical protein CEUSTIGMA_g6582.t1 [Chlamydomonas eustigma]
MKGMNSAGKRTRSAFSVKPNIALGLPVDQGYEGTPVAMSSSKLAKKNATTSAKKRQRTGDVQRKRQAASAQKDTMVLAFREYYQASVQAASYQSCTPNKQKTVFASPFRSLQLYTVFEGHADDGRGLSPAPVTLNTSKGTPTWTPSKTTADDVSKKIPVWTPSNRGNGSQVNQPVPFMNPALPHLPRPHRMSPAFTGGLTMAHLETLLNTQPSLVTSRTLNKSSMTTSAVGCLGRENLKVEGELHNCRVEDVGSTDVGRINVGSTNVGSTNVEQMLSSEEGQILSNEEGQVLNMEEEGQVLNMEEEGHAVAQISNAMDVFEVETEDMSKGDGSIRNIHDASEAAQPSQRELLVCLHSRNQSHEKVHTHNRFNCQDQAEGLLAPLELTFNSASARLCGVDGGTSQDLLSAVSAEGASNLIVNLEGTPVLEDDQRSDLEGTPGLEGDHKSDLEGTPGLEGDHRSDLEGTPGLEGDKKNDGNGENKEEEGSEPSLHDQVDKLVSSLTSWAEDEVDMKVRLEGEGHVELATSFLRPRCTDIVAPVFEQRPVLHDCAKDLGMHGYANGDWSVVDDKISGASANIMGKEATCLGADISKSTSLPSTGLLFHFWSAPEAGRDAVQHQRQPRAMSSLRGVWSSLRAAAAAAADRVMGGNSPLGTPLQPKKLLMPSPSPPPQTMCNAEDTSLVSRPASSTPAPVAHFKGFSAIAADDTWKTGLESLHAKSRSGSSAQFDSERVGATFDALKAAAHSIEPTEVLRGSDASQAVSASATLSNPIACIPQEGSQPTGHSSLSLLTSDGIPDPPLQSSPCPLTSSTGNDTCVSAPLEGSQQIFSTYCHDTFPMLSQEPPLISFLPAPCTSQPIASTSRPADLQPALEHYHYNKQSGSSYSTCLEQATPVLARSCTSKGLPPITLTAAATSRRALSPYSTVRSGSRLPSIPSNAISTPPTRNVQIFCDETLSSPNCDASPSDHTTQNTSPYSCIHGKDMSCSLKYIAPHPSPMSLCPSQQSNQSSFGVLPPLSSSPQCSPSLTSSGSTVRSPLSKSVFLRQQSRVSNLSSCSTSVDSNLTCMNPFERKRRQAQGLLGGTHSGYLQQQRPGGSPGGSRLVSANSSSAFAAGQLKSGSPLQHSSPGRLDWMKSPGRLDWMKSPRAAMSSTAGTNSYIAPGGNKTGNSDDGSFQEMSVKELLEGLPSCIFTIQRSLAPLPQRRAKRKQVAVYRSPSLHGGHTGRHGSMTGAMPCSPAPLVPVYITPEQSVREALLDARLAVEWLQHGLAWARMDVHGMQIEGMPIESYLRRLTCAESKLTEIRGQICARRYLEILEAEWQKLRSLRMTLCSRRGSRSGLVQVRRHKSELDSALVTVPTPFENGPGQLGDAFCEIKISRKMDLSSKTTAGAGLVMCGEDECIEDTAISRSLEGACTQPTEPNEVVERLDEVLQPLEMIKDAIFTGNSILKDVCSKTRCTGVRVAFPSPLTFGQTCLYK